MSKATENQARSHETEHLFGSEFQKLFKKVGVVLRRRRRREEEHWGSRRRHRTQALKPMVAWK